MTQTALQRLLKYPHAAVFDVAPASELAFRLRHASGASWAIADRVLTATAGALVVSHDLRQYTVDGLATALTADGFTIESLSAKFSGMSAVVLVEGLGDQSQSNGDHIMGFTSLLWVLLSGYADELLGAKEQVRHALLQMVIGTADGEWLDLWATLYDVPRLHGETDAALRVRIPREAFRARNNARAIELAIRDATGFDVRIEEPWREIFQLDNSELSGSAKFQDGQRVGHHLIQPMARQYVDWSTILPVIDRNRAAGVLVLPPIVRYTAHLVAADTVVLSGLLEQNFCHSRYEDRALLDYSDIEEVSIQNYACRYRREILHSSSSAIPNKIWSDIPWFIGDWSSTYVSTSQHQRDYRVYYTSLDYGGDWSGVRTWATADSSWADFSPAIYSLHTST